MFPPTNIPFHDLGKKQIRDPSDFLSRYSVKSGAGSATREFGLDDEFGSLLDEDAIDGIEDADAMFAQEQKSSSSGKGNGDGRSPPRRYQYS